jgi:TPR repeat protein
MRGRRIFPGMLAVAVAMSAAVAILGAIADPSAPLANADAEVLRATMSQGRDLLAASASPDDARIIRNVTIRVAPDLIQAHSAAASITMSGRDVVVALSLAHELSLAAEIQYVERVFGISNLMQLYFRHFNEAWMYNGRKLLSIEDFVFLDEAGRTKLHSPEIRRQLQGWLEYALIFALAHELGHHARNALYLANDPDEEKRKKERIADEWATEAMLAAGYSPLHGVMLLTILMDFQERNLPSGYQSSHPPTAERALHLLNKYRAQQHAIYQSPRYSSIPLKTYIALEEQWAKELEAMRQRRATRTIANMEQQSSAGDVDASTSLAIDYMNGIGVPRDAVKAALYLERAATAGDFWAQSTLGVMYSNGALGAPDFARARFWMGLAAVVGEKAALANLNTVSKIAPPVSWCQGKCTLDAALANLTPCVTRERSGCIDSCEHRYGHTRSECENRFCNNMSDEQRYFSRCFVAPSAGTWQACAASCDPTASPMPVSTGSNLVPGTPSFGAKQAVPADDFGRVFQQVVEAARQDFASIRATAMPRDSEDTSTDYKARLSLPGMTDCLVTVYDNTGISSNYVCDQYRGHDSREAIRTYRSVVSRVNSALAIIGVGPCTESVRRTGSRIPRDVTECRSKLLGGVEVRVRQTNTTYASTASTDCTTDLWVDAPQR